MRVLIPFLRSRPLWPSHLPQSPAYLLILSPWALGFNICVWKGHEYSVSIILYFVLWFYPTITTELHLKPSRAFLPIPVCPSVFSAKECFTSGWNFLQPGIAHLALFPHQVWDTWSHPECPPWPPTKGWPSNSSKDPSLNLWESQEPICQLQSYVTLRYQHPPRFSFPRGCSGPPWRVESVWDC